MEKNIHKDSDQLKDGNLNIADEVLSTIASIAASEVEGVTAMSSGIADGIVEMFGKKPMGKGVKIEKKDDEIKIDLFIVVNYGVRIPDVAWEVQDNVKKSIEAMTGLNAVQVNIHVQGVNFSKEVVHEEKQGVMKE